MDWYANVGVGDGMLLHGESSTCVRYKWSLCHGLFEVVTKDFDDRSEVGLEVVGSKGSNSGKQ
jgi:hypothetical protein